MAPPLNEVLVKFHISVDHLNLPHPRQPRENLLQYGIIVWQGRISRFPVMQVARFVGKLVPLAW